MAKGRERKTKSALGGSFTTLRFGSLGGGSEKWKEKNPSANTFVYPSCCYAIHIPHTAERPEKASKKLFFPRHFWHGGRGKEFFLPGFSKIYRTIPLTLKKEVQQRRVGEKRKLPLALPPSHFFLSPIDIGSESVSSSSFGWSVSHTADS